MNRTSIDKKTFSELPIAQSKLVLLARWCLLGFMAATAWFLTTSKLVLLIILLAYGILLALSSLGLIPPGEKLAHNWPYVMLEMIFAITVIYLTGGMISPFWLILLAYVVIESMRFGFGGLILSYMMVIGFVMVMAVLSFHITFSLVTLIATTAICGFMVAGYSTIRRSEINSQISISQVISKEQNKLKLLINSMAEAVFIIDRSGRVVLYNGAALEFLDTHVDILNKPFNKILPLERTDNQSVDLAAQVIKEQHLILQDDLVFHRGQHTINVYATINPIAENGVVEGALILVRDISRQKTLAAQKDEFISIISHELRTPVAVVEADLSTVLMPGFVKLPDKALKLVRSAQSSLVYLQSLLKDLSELSQADRSVLDIELNKIESVDLINEVVKDLHSKSQESGIALHTELATNLPSVFSSKERLKEILVNLVTNAIKYSGDGKIVTLVARPSIKLHGGVQFSVVDQGIGLSQSDQNKLFTKFFRSESAETQKVKGTGMGLYISKRQAERIGASIWLQSKLGVGSTFFLEVPLKIPGEHKFTTDVKTT